MKDNPYVEYYKSQAGTGIVAYQGVKYQRGHGFFGRVMSNALVPLLKFLGKRAVGVGSEIAKDVLVDNKNWKESAKNRLKAEGENLADRGAERAKKFIQEGKGSKRKRKSNKSKRKQKQLKIADLMT